jgi:ubiquinone/menaquinone biosynthesis C-methylase UbiE
MNSNRQKFHQLWEESAKTYSLIDESYYPAKIKMNLLRKFTSSESVCLDIGIANGIYSIPLSNQVKSIDGIDISQKMLDKCAESMALLEISNIFLHNQSAEKLLFNSEIFDLAFSFATLALVPNINDAFKEIARVLNITGEINLSRIHWEKYYRSIGHFGLNSFQLPNIIKKFDQLGFDMIENHSIGLLDQWKYIPGLNRMKIIERITHSKNSIPDLDYRFSQLLPDFANHWILVFKKK